VEAHEDETSLLARLGLTICQAKVYLTLIRYGVCTAQEISKASKITRQDVYRILPKLHDAGLVRKAITSPATFAAVPIEDGVEYLMERRTDETRELQSKTKELVARYKQNRTKVGTNGQESEFVLIPRGRAIAKKRAWEIDNLQKSLDAIISFARYLPSMTDNSEALMRAMDRGVKVRTMTEKPLNISSFPKTVRPIKEHPCFSIRFIAAPPKSLVSIYDGKQVIISISPQAKLYKSHALWSNNPSLLEVCREYFDKMWDTSVEM
jgi:sugar-specific transcriptional regulator TrmB